jgi:glutaredoxin-like protein NrdH
MPKLPVVVYEKDGCQQCRATCRWLEDKGIEFRCVNLEKSAAAAEFVREMGHQQAPVVIVPFDREGVGGQHWSGFRPDLLGQLV